MADLAQRLNEAIKKLTDSAIDLTASTTVPEIEHFQRDSQMAKDEVRELLLKVREMERGTK